MPETSIQLFQRGQTFKNLTWINPDKTRGLKKRQPEVPKIKSQMTNKFQVSINKTKYKQKELSSGCFENLNFVIYNFLSPVTRFVGGKKTRIFFIRH